jgi:hypothetical protein
VCAFPVAVDRKRDRPANVRASRRDTCRLGTGALELAAWLVPNGNGLTRVIVGLRYPGDVVGGALIGFLSALLVVVAAGGRWVPVVRLLSRVSDPLVMPAWNALDAYKAKRRARSTV